MKTYSDTYFTHLFPRPNVTIATRCILLNLVERKAFTVSLKTQKHFSPEPLAHLYTLTLKLKLTVIDSNTLTLTHQMTKRKTKIHKNTALLNAPGVRVIIFHFSCRENATMKILKFTLFQLNCWRENIV